MNYEQTEWIVYTFLAELDKFYYEKYLKEPSRRRPAPTAEPSDANRPTPTDRPARTDQRGGHGNSDHHHHGNQIERRQSERFHGGDKTLKASGRSMSEDVHHSVVDSERKSNKAQFKRKPRWVPLSRCP